MAITGAPSELAELLIAEARRRAHRRRLLVAGAVAVVGGAAWTALPHGAAPTHAGAATPPAPPKIGRALLPAPNGPLTIVKWSIRALGPPWRDGLGPTLWDCQGVRGKCWEPEGVAWSPDGRRLAFGGESIGGAAKYDGLHVVDLRTGAVR